METFISLSTVATRVGKEIQGDLILTEARNTVEETMNVEVEGLEMGDVEMIKERVTHLAKIVQNVCLSL